MEALFAAVAPIVAQRVKAKPPADAPRSVGADAVSHPALTRPQREFCPAGLDIPGPLCYYVRARLAAAPHGGRLSGVRGAREKPLGLIDQAVFLLAPRSLLLRRIVHPLAPARPIVT